MHKIGIWERNPSTSDVVWNEAIFYRASTSSSGTGLGVYICKEMLTKLGGEIILSSDLSIGTTIEITLPQHFTTLNETIYTHR